MRPTSRPQSALRCPLNHVLGTEAAVRVLRVLFLSDVPIGVSELARRAALQASGVGRLCARLEDLGVLEAVGRGTRNRQYRRAERFPFTAPLRELFERERERAERLISDLQGAVRSSPGIAAAWLQGPVALGHDLPGDALVVGVLAEERSVGRIRASLNARLLPIQRSYDVVVEVRVVTAADLTTAGREERRVLETVVPLRGAPPLDVIGGGQARRVAPRGRRHADLDARALAIARAVAARLGRDPSLIEDALRHIARRLPAAAPSERQALEEWRELLSSLSVARLRRFLVQDDARARRLRQSLPFVSALTDQERRAVFEEIQP